MDSVTTTFRHKAKSDRSSKKISTSIRVSRVIHQVALDDQNSRQPVFDSINDFYETGAKLMMLFGRKSLADVKKWVEGQ